MNAILPILRAGAVEVGEPRRRRFTVDDISAMVETGLVDPKARIELLEGEIVEMPPEGELYRTYKVALTRALILALADLDLEVGPDMSLILGPDDAPEPDLYVYVAGESLKLTPGASVPLVVEIADSSLTYDLSRKAAKYASYGIAEYWVVDLNARQTHVLTEPADGVYHAATAIPFNAELRPSRLPKVGLTIASLRGIPAA